MANFFARALLKWHRDNPRPMPWSIEHPDPYHVWLSEIILQQTRVKQGTDYYLRFVHHFPSIHDLASSSIDDVMRLWQGLGYYTRARNLHKAAKHVVENLGGHFPDHHDALLTLPGVGPYSAAAISSFAFGHKHVVVDGNVKRVIARYTGITKSIDDTAVHEQIRKLAFDFMEKVSPALFNQAIMNFGALVCKPKAPLCNTCPISSHCFAFQNNIVDVLPVKTKKKPVRNRFFHFLLIRYRGRILMHRREENDIWQGLYSLPHLEHTSSRSPGKIPLLAFAFSIIGSSTCMMESSDTKVYQQILSHQLIHGRFYSCTLSERPKRLSKDYKWVNIAQLEELGKPKMIVQYFKSYSGPG
ncbi:MAG TPA: A/G-specific adenine glycosylase [Saprospiraceae bacterium]|nr:A/G-specific adenine glycosylase [Saprospiraceae bacterium]